jgi:quercetin dioxygenase-like cupin family protein
MIGSSTYPPLVRNAADAEQRWFFGGGVHSWKATSEETGGSFLLFEDTMDRGKCTPLHTHPVDETMYVIDGTIRMHVNGTEHTISAGGVVIAPRGVPHAFLVSSPTARVLWLHTPGTCEAFYREASEPLTPDTERVVDFDRVRAAAQAVGGIEILGPPPFGD